MDLLHDLGSPWKSRVYPVGSRAFKAWRMFSAHIMSPTPPSISESYSALGPAQTRVILLLLNYFGCFFSKTSKRSRGKGEDRTSRDLCCCLTGLKGSLNEKSKINVGKKFILVGVILDERNHGWNSGKGVPQACVGMNNYHGWPLRGAPDPGRM